jgi:hypothetical protein
MLRAGKIVGTAGSVWVMAIAVLCISPAAPVRRETLRSTSRDLRLVVGAAISLPVDGLPLQIFASAPDDEPNHLLVCSFEEDGEHAQHPSSAYVSLDAGTSWMRTLRDANSDWVSETSCAAGTKSRAYFVAGVSDTPAGVPDHTRGTTEVYQSFDSGLTWAVMRRYPFIDWTFLLVSDLHEKNEELHLFGHELAAGSGDRGEGVWVARKGVLLTSRDGVHFASPRFAPMEGDESKIGCYPLGAVAKEDGSVISLFARNPGPGKRLEYVLYRIDGTSYAALSRIEFPPGLIGTNLLSAQIAWDRSGSFRGRLYVAFPAVRHEQSVLGLAWSDDEGKTWQVQELLSAPRPLKSTFGYSSYAGVAVNASGIVGLSWLPAGQCPIFAVSADGGASISESRMLGSCLRPDDVEELAAAGGKRIWIMNSAQTDSIADSVAAAPGLTANVRTGTPWSVQLLSDAAGNFHVFWTETGTDGGTLTKTARVSVGSAPPTPVGLGNLQDVTGTSIIHVLRNDFDPYSGLFHLDIAVQNASNGPIPYPSLLAVEKEHSDCGPIRYASTDLMSEDGRTLFQIPQRSDPALLSPGERTLPLHLEVEVDGCRSGEATLLEKNRERRGRFSPLAIRFQIYAPISGKDGPGL